MMKKKYKYELKARNYMYTPTEPFCEALARCESPAAANDWLGISIGGTIMGCNNAPEMSCYLIAKTI